MTSMTLPALIQRFFTDRLCVQMEASHHTIASYRDTRLLLRYAGSRLANDQSLSRSKISTSIWLPTFWSTPKQHGATVHVAVTGLAAIRSFFRYVAMADPTWMLNCQRILAMPNAMLSARSRS